MTHKKSQGSSVIVVLVALFVVIAFGFGGWYVWHKSSEKAVKNASNTASSTPKSAANNVTHPDDPYTGWKVATSPRANFSIKYPADWTYGEALGTKDNVEHITIDSSTFHFTIDSYSGRDVQSGGQPATACTDCVQVTSSTGFRVNNLGETNLETVVYKLDNGKGNALILALPDSTYYIPSPSRTGVHTSFRGISMLDSELAYQAETPAQFAANSDFATAEKILESVSY
ncbi:MAG TPA: hypothetical protein VLH84_00470 [Patescibacteria group bacterium]|nr:hypothetical protein [Patescibacteria group bacterium]